MKFLIKWWFILSLISLAFYTPIYLFSNDAVDAVEEATLVELLPTVGITNRDYERELAHLKRSGIDTDKALDDALDDNPLIENYDIALVDSDEARKILRIGGWTMVEVKAQTRNGNTMSLVFSTLDKKFLKHPAGVGPLVSFNISNGQASHSVRPEDMQLYLTVLFADEEKDAQEVITRLEGFLPAKEQYAKQYQQMFQAMGTLTGTAAEPAAAEAAVSLQAVIDRHVAEEIGREGGDEYRDGRSVVEVDINGDGEQDALVLYSIEGQGGGNGSFQTLALFLAQNGGYVFNASAVVNGSASDVKLLDRQTIGVSTLTLGEDDAMCCPSVESVQKFSWDGQALHDVTQS
ncbi:LppP/LprE family lipoprotein [Pseudomonas lopnurensis]|uniref:LppP/LprE family lipoprotein n=1 Tax=Pseudomonas lopnurensis TaxID=1477517 RepID=UPI0028B0EDEF|nr:LppP/LprE family lipoprotein [Pseudomonas lopnurensis]